MAPILVLAAVAALVTPAEADDDTVIVNPNGRGWIDTTVEDEGKPARVRPARQERRKPPARTCSQEKSEFAGGYGTNAQFASGAPAGEGPGGWVTRRCSDGTLDTAWVAVTEPVKAVTTAAQLAQRATNRMKLPLPEPRFEPRRNSSAGAATLVAIPTWFYLDGWEPVSQRTRAGGVWAEVTATPVETIWWPGDGTGPLRCSGPGRAWSANDDGADSPCRHTYRRSSAAQPDNVYPARVTVTWRVTWTGPGGLDGSLPLMERQTTFPVAVAERQTVIVRGDER